MILAVNLSLRGNRARAYDSFGSTYNRELLDGIMQFAMSRPDVKLWFSDPIFAQTSDPDHVDGIIGAKFFRRLAMVTESTPIVNVISDPIEGAPQVCCDDSRLSRLAFNHFFDCNLRHFAYLHIVNFKNSERRKLEFGSICEAKGFFLHVLESEPGVENIRSNHRLIQVMKSLPKPVGLLLPEDAYGIPLIGICNDLGLRVPEDVALLGIANDSEICLSCQPRLSSMDIDVKRIGYVAAETLVDVLDGKDVEKIRLIPPKELVARDSTVPNKALSPGVAAVVNFMHAHLGEPVEMEDLVAEQELGRRALEKAFQAEMEESPMHYLRTLRLDRVKYLLATTDETVTEIARQCGFRHANYLCRLFQKFFETTPHRYRKTSRRRA